MRYNQIRTNQRTPMTKVLDITVTALLALVFMFALTVTGAMLVRMQTVHYNSILQVK